MVPGVPGIALATLWHLLPDRLWRHNGTGREGGRTTWRNSWSFDEKLSNNTPEISLLSDNQFANDVAKILCKHLSKSNWTYDHCTLPHLMQLCIAWRLRRRAPEEGRDNQCQTFLLHLGLLPYHQWMFSKFRPQKFATFLGPLAKQKYCTSTRGRAFHLHLTPGRAWDLAHHEYTASSYSSHLARTLSAYTDHCISLNIGVKLCCGCP